ncbi:MAG: Hpt domain-containing protein [Oscillospiraceae bacterium]|nr:Hpt domain-containing protein [Oscillospiraceae bacterium]
MTLKECYESIGADFDAAVARMCNKEAMLLKFALKFPADPTYPALVEAYEGGDIPTAFRMAHTLKGLCLNLGLDKLRESSAALTEALRDNANPAPNADELYEEVKRDYEATRSALGSVEA